MHERLSQGSDIEKRLVEKIRLSFQQFLSLVADGLKWADAGQGDVFLKQWPPFRHDHVKPQEPKRPDDKGGYLKRSQTAYVILIILIAL